MKELAKEYKLSLKVLNERINELKSQKDMLALESYSPIREGEIEELKARLKPLNAMLSDLKAVTKEVCHYYGRNWWRSEKFTLNQRKSRQFVYSGPIYDESFDECGEDSEDEENAEYGNGFIID